MRSKFVDTMIVSVPTFFLSSQANGQQVVMIFMSGKLIFLFLSYSF